MFCIRKLLYMITTLTMTVTTIQAGSMYHIDPTVGPGYIWHSHIPGRKDNEMMRPY